MNIAELIDNFELLDDWEDKYRYLIDLGGKLEPLDEQYHSEEWKISGCQSQVWLVPTFLPDGTISFAGDSDAAIVRGLLAVVLSIFDGKTSAEIKDIDIAQVLTSLGLQEHLSPSRRNGLNSMVEKIMFYAGK